MSTSSTDAMRSLVAGLMPRARDDLAELVAFRSVADPAQCPPAECGTGDFAVGVPTLTSTLRGMTSVDPGEIERIALAEALFLERYAATAGV